MKIKRIAEGGCWLEAAYREVYKSFLLVLINSINFLSQNTTEIDKSIATSIMRPSSAEAREVAAGHVG